MITKNKYAAALLLLGIIVLAVTVRKDTVWLPHFRGDEGHYLSLAMKLDRGGLPFYNLRGVEVANITNDQLKAAGVELGYPAYMPVGDGKGTLLRVLERIGLGYYDIPFLHMPPLFAYTLKLSHTLFMGAGKPYLIVVADPSLVIYKAKPMPMLTFQLYAIIVPLFFSIALIVLTYLIGRYLFNSAVGLIAALLIAVNPVDIMTAQKLWADDQTAFLFACAFIFFIIGLKRANRVIIFLSGVVCGLAFLAKNTGGFFIPLAWGISFLWNTDEKWDMRAILARAFNVGFVLFLAGFIAATGWWFYRMYALYGAPQHWPLFLSQFHEAVKNDVTGFYTNLARRPSGLILYPVTSVAMCPLLICALLTMKTTIKNITRLFCKKRSDLKMVWLWAVVFTFWILLTVISGKEDRYFLPAYPFLSIAAAVGVQSLRVSLVRYARAERLPYAYILANSVILAAIIVSSAWAIHLGMAKTVKGALLIQFPF